MLEVVTGAVKTKGQTYFGDFRLPAGSLYKSIEGTIASRAQGHDQVPRMDTVEYATAVVDAITARTAGKFWYGNHAEQVRMGTTATAVPQSAMVSSHPINIIGFFFSGLGVLTEGNSRIRMLELFLGLDSMHWRNKADFRLRGDYDGGCFYKVGQ